MSGKSRSGELNGSDGGERFETFLVQWSREDQALSYFSEHPELSATVSKMVFEYATFLVELLERLHHDGASLGVPYDGQKGALSPTRIELKGDIHCQGRCVAVVEWEKGHLRWVYKPRHPGGERAFDALLAWYETDAPHQHYPMRRVLGENYGWHAYCQALPCDSIKEVEAFYWRMGHLTALLYLLMARDIHAENIIAVGAYPALIDLEVLLPPKVAEHYRHHYGKPPDLMRTLILPHWIREHPFAPGFDAGALAGMDGITPMKRMCWREPGTDRMKISWENLRLTPGSNRIRFDGNIIEPADYESSFRDGFRFGFERIQTEKTYLLSAHSVLQMFRDARARLVLRITSEYRRILEHLYAYGAFQSTSVEDLFFKHLYSDPDGSGAFHLLAAAEAEDLSTANLPLFQACCNEREILDSRGRAIDLQVVESGFEQLMNHIKDNFNMTNFELLEGRIAESFTARRRHLGQGRRK